MQHLLDIHQLQQDDVHKLIQRAMHFKQYLQYPQYPGRS